MSDDECWCEYVDIGVGMQRVAEIPGCPKHMPYPDELPCLGLDCAGCDMCRCAALPNGQGPACDWDHDCPECGREPSRRRKCCVTCGCECSCAL